MLFLIKKRSEKYLRMRVGTTYDTASSSSLRSPIILGGHVPLCPGGSVAYDNELSLWVFGIP